MYIYTYITQQQDIYDIHKSLVVELYFLTFKDKKAY